MGPKWRGEIGNFGENLRLDPMHAGKNERRSRPSLRATDNSDSRKKCRNPPPELVGIELVGL
jgi:hypothetical protein